MQSFNLIEMWHSMAPLAKAVNVLLAICSIYSLWVIIDRFFSLRSVRSKSVKFVVILREQLRSKSMFRARSTSRTRMDESPVARLVRDALTELKEGQEGLLAKGGVDPEYDPIEAVERVIDRNKEREVADLKRGLGGLASISSAAPFIGLFGTVVGIINAFRSMAATGQGGLGAVSAGISEALFTTAVGLVVAIPGRHDVQLLLDGDRALHGRHERRGLRARVLHSPRLALPSEPAANAAAAVPLGAAAGVPGIGAAAALSATTSGLAAPASRAAGRLVSAAARLSAPLTS